MEHFSGDLAYARCWRSVIRPPGLRWVSVELLGLGLAQLPGSSLAGRYPMTTAAPSTALAAIQPAFTNAERVALVGFLAGYRGLTREAYALDLRQFAGWCRTRAVALFAVRRVDIEGFARDLEAMGRARATVTRRLSTIAGFYKYAVEEELLDRSPAAHVRRPRVDYESHAVALDRNELGALLASVRRPGMR
jgi:integrase